MNPSQIKRVIEEEEEESEIEWEVDGEGEDEAKAALGMVGRLWTERNVNANALIATMKRIWNLTHGMEANCVEKNVFFFQFHHWKDKEKVMEGQAWHFERHTLALSDINGEERLSEMNLHIAPFWVRVYDLPFVGRSNDANARKIGNKVGAYIGMDTSDVVGINKSLRIRTMVDLRKPLEKEVRLKMRGGNIEKFGVKYEKLPFLLCMWKIRARGERL